MQHLPAIVEAAACDPSHYVWHWHDGTFGSVEEKLALGYVFNCDLRKADGVDLGLVISHSESEESMLVEDVLPNGTIQAWNKLCHCVSHCDSRRPHEHHYFRAGDKIMSVNGIWKSVSDMVHACNSASLLRFCVVRGEGHPLRPCARPFVPGMSSHDSSHLVPVGGVRDVRVL